MTIPNTRSLDPGSSQDLKSLNLKDETLASYSSDSMSTAAASLGFSREIWEGKVCGRRRRRRMMMMMMVMMVMTVRDDDDDC